MDLSKGEAVILEIVGIADSGRVLDTLIWTYSRSGDRPS